MRQWNTTQHNITLDKIQIERGLIHCNGAPVPGLAWSGGWPIEFQFNGRVQFAVNITISRSLSKTALTSVMAILGECLPGFTIQFKPSVHARTQTNPMLSSRYSELWRYLNRFREPRALAYKYRCILTEASRVRWHIRTGMIQEKALLPCSSQSAA